MAVFTGSCSCGALKYEVTEQPVQKALCHCSNCQKVSGSAYTTNIMVPRASYKVTAGTPKNYTFIQQPTQIPFTIAFCGDCSSVIGKGSENPAFAPVYMVPAGSVDGGEGMEIGRPDAELWVPMRAGWVKEVEGSVQLKGFT